MSTTIKNTYETPKTFAPNADGEDVDEHLYRSMIGSLMYLTSSRPDIMFVVCQPKLGLWYPKDIPFDLVAYTDSDYARASLDRKSTTRGINLLLLVKLMLPGITYYYWTTVGSVNAVRLNLVLLVQVNVVEDEGLGDQEDASKQGRKIADIDADVEITLVDETRGRNDKEMFDIGILDGEEVFAEQDVVENEVSTAKVATNSTTATTVDELTLAQTLIEIKVAKPKAITRPKDRLCFMIKTVCSRSSRLLDAEIGKKKVKRWRRRGKNRTQDKDMKSLCCSERMLALRRGEERSKRLFRKEDGRKRGSRGEEGRKCEAEMERKKRDKDERDKKTAAGEEEGRRREGDQKARGRHGGRGGDEKAFFWRSMQRKEVKARRKRGSEEEMDEEKEKEGRVERKRKKKKRKKEDQREERKREDKED
ncbi:hypothetical protein Tco_0359864 [Tanacetum coccineum]